MIGGAIEVHCMTGWSYTVCCKYSHFYNLYDTPVLFCLASILDHIKAMFIVQKHVDKCSVLKKFRKEEKSAICRIQTWVFRLEGTELNQQAIWTVA